MPPRRLLLPLLVLPLLPAAAGCGGKGRVLDFQIPGVREAWVARANRICADRAAAVRRLPTPRTQADLLDAGARIVSLQDLEYSRLAATHPLVRDRDRLSSLLASIRRIQRGIERVRSALTLHDASELAAARAALAAARRDANAESRALGLGCRH
jgi:hypothetical protein